MKVKIFQFSETPISINQGEQRIAEFIKNKEIKHILQTPIVSAHGPVWIFITIFYEEKK